MHEGGIKGLNIRGLGVLTLKQRVPDVAISNNQVIRSLGERP